MLTYTCSYTYRKQSWLVKIKNINTSHQYFYKHYFFLLLIYIIYIVELDIEPESLHNYSSNPGGVFGMFNNY